MIEEIKRVYLELDSLLREFGYGSTSRVQTAADVSESYLRDLRGRLAAGQKKNYDLGVLLPMLEALGVERRIFYSRIYNTPGPISKRSGNARESIPAPGTSAP